MSNGVAYVLDEAGTFPSRLNHEMVLLADLDSEDEQLLEILLRLQFTRTGSARARSILDSWGRGIGQWRKVKPRGAQESVAAIRQLWTSRLQSLLETDGAAKAGRVALRA